LIIEQQLALRDLRPMKRADHYQAAAAWQDTAARFRRISQDGQWLCCPDLACRRAGGPPRQLLVLLHGVVADGPMRTRSFRCSLCMQQSRGCKRPEFRCSGRCAGGLPHGIDSDSVALAATFLAAAFAQSGA
jgi:hypothetical protein